MPKKDSKLRLCVDYRALNKVTVPDNYMLPRIAYIKQHLRGNIFSALDLKEGFWQVPVLERDVHKTAMATPWGSYEFVRMPFGLRNAPPTFQRFVNMVLHGVENIFVYIDDIIIFSRTYDEHIIHLDTVFQRLHQHGLIINTVKSKFFRTKVEYLGYEFSPLGYQPLESAWPNIEKFPVPKDRMDVQSFIGKVNYYRAHIPNLAEIAAPLYALTKKEKSFNWTDEHTTAFNRLKILFQERIVLSPIAPDAQFA